MIHHEAGRFYENKLSLYKNALLSVKKKINVISNVRLAVTLVFLTGANMAGKSTFLRSKMGIIRDQLQDHIRVSTPVNSASLFTT